MAQLDLPDVRLHYDISGEGPPLVLVHGSAVDRGTWAGVVTDLSGFTLSLPTTVEAMESPNTALFGTTDYTRMI